MREKKEGTPVQSKRHWRIMVDERTNLNFTKLFSAKNVMIDPYLEKLRSGRIMDWLSNIFGYTMPVKTRICRNEQKSRIGKLTLILNTQRRIHLSRIIWQRWGYWYLKSKGEQWCIVQMFQQRWYIRYPQRHLKPLLCWNDWSLQIWMVRKSQYTII